jgi:formamidopyrimidine-DNA glycosylase
MPELPEVEIVKNFLSKSIVGKTVSQVVVFNHKLRYHIPEEIENIVGLNVVQLKRRAKYIQIFLSNDQILVIHLGMSGRVLIYDHNYVPEKHDHIIFYVNSNVAVVYNDPRKFGFIDLINLADLSQYKFFRALGVEPLTDDFNFDLLYKILSNSKLGIKKLLMDSSFIVGIGNIYASEILFKTKIHPMQISSEVPKSMIPELLLNIKEILHNAIHMGGSSIKNFVNPEGNKGDFSGKFQVYGRFGSACIDCEGKIEKLIIQQRSTFFCPKCQMLL